MKRTTAQDNRAKRLRPMGDSRPRNEFMRTGVPFSKAVAKTTEWKYMDSELQLANIGVCTTTWVAGTLADPTTTINLGSAAVATPGCLCAPTVGAALNQRVGRKISISKIKVRGTVVVGTQTPANGGETASKVRLLLVQDMQSNAGAMTSAQLLRDAGVATTTINSFQNPDNFGRFRVLKDINFVLQDPNAYTDAVPAAAMNGIKRNFKMNVTFKQPVKVQFNATNGGTIADIVDNSFHIIAGTDAGALTPQLSYYARVAYLD